MSEQCVTINSMRFGPEEKRDFHYRKKEPDVLDLGNGIYAPYYMIRHRKGGVLISTRKPDMDVIVHIMFGSVVWDCVPILIAGQDRTYVQPDKNGYYLLKHGESYTFIPPSGYGERILHLGSEP